MTYCIHTFLNIFSMSFLMNSCDTIGWNQKIIYSNFGMAFNWPFGAALASILLFVSVFVISLTNYITKKKS